MILYLSYQDAHGEGGRSECKVESGHAPDNLFRDVMLKCRDGSVGWSKFLLAANSPLLNKSLSQTEQDEGCDVILLPGKLPLLFQAFGFSTINKYIWRKDNFWDL